MVSHLRRRGVHSRKLLHPLCTEDAPPLEILSKLGLFAKKPECASVRVFTYWCFSANNMKKARFCVLFSWRRVRDSNYIRKPRWGFHAPVQTLAHTFIFFSSMRKENASESLLVQISASLKFSERDNPSPLALSPCSFGKFVFSFWGFESCPKAPAGLS